MSQDNTTVRVCMGICPICLTCTFCHAPRVHMSDLSHYKMTCPVDTVWMNAQLPMSEMPCMPLYAPVPMGGYVHLCPLYPDAPYWPLVPPYIRLCPTFLPLRGSPICPFWAGNNGRIRRFLRKQDKSDTFGPTNPDIPTQKTCPF